MKVNKIKREAKVQILNRMIQSKEMLLEWGFNATSHNFWNIEFIIWNNSKENE